MNKIVERTDARFEPSNVTKHEHLLRYKFACRRSGKVVLDLGCGFGYGAKMLHDCGKDVVGIDFSEDAIAYAKQNYPGPKYSVGSGGKIPFPDDHFDSVVAFEVIEHIEDAEGFLSEIHRVLKNGGALFISTPNPRHLGSAIRHYAFGKPWPQKIDENNIYHIKEYPYRSFLDLLKNNGFKIEEKFGQILSMGGRTFINSWLGKKLISNKYFSLLIIFSGYFFPQLSMVVVVKARKS